MKIARIEGPSGPVWATVDTDRGTVQPIAGALADWAPAVLAGKGHAAVAATGGAIPLAAARFLPPIDPAAQVFVVGANYQKHLDELSIPTPKAPVAFLKSRRALIGAGDDIHRSPLTKELDYEVELVAVLGAPLPKSGNPIPSVLGYTVGNDISCRDLQKAGAVGMDLFSGKSIDHTTVLGPWIVTRDEFGDASPDLRLSLAVNGEMRQDSRTGLMIWKLDEILRFVDARVALQPGDVLYTGTPEGVAWADGRFLNPGDVVECTIEKIGSFRNTVKQI